MLDSLFGSKNIQRILLFIFVNRSCYGTQLQRCLKTSLTPLQKALLKLEKGGIIQSQSEGKTRLYQFNPKYPLLNELEALLKKSYILLNPQEKKHFHCHESGIRFSAIQAKQQRVIIDHFWERLKLIKKLSFSAESKSDSGWNGKGKGDVIVLQETELQLVFSERGLWKNSEGNDIDFSNVFRWTLDQDTALISLETLRRGWNHPLFLFHLSPTGTNSLGSVDSHLCNHDAYLGKLLFDPFSLKLLCRTIGPKKNEEIEYCYT